MNDRRRKGKRLYIYPKVTTFIIGIVALLFSYSVLLLFITRFLIHHTELLKRAHIQLITEKLDLYLEAENYNLLFFSSLILFIVLMFVYLIRSVRFIRKSHEEYYVNLANKEIIEYLSDGILIFDLKGRLIHCNFPASRFLELENQEDENLTNGHYKQLFGDVRDLTTIIESGLLNRKLVKERTVRLGSEKDSKELLVSSFFPENEQSSLIGLAVLLQDSERLNQVSQRIRRTERLSAVGRLSSEIAHEIRNPLSAMGMNLQLLQEKLSKILEDMTYDKIRNHLNVLDYELKRLTNFLEYFTHISRKRPLRLKWVDIHKLTDGVLKLIKPNAGENNVDIKKTYAPALPATRCDPDQIRQVVLNLINNALYAMRDGGTLSISTEHNIKKDTVEIHIKDTGVGIKASEMDKIFDWYYTSKSGGTGLGLGIAHQIITRHKGTLDVKSRVNEGTRFVIELPVAGPWRQMEE